MSKNLIYNQIGTTYDGKFQVFPSKSLYTPTSSAPATAAQFDIIIPPEMKGDMISNTESNPYIKLPIISSSNTGTDFDVALVVRFFTSSHFEDELTGSFSSQGGGSNVSASYSSLYYTGSGGEKFVDTLIDPGTTGEENSTAVRNTIHDLIRLSSYGQSSLISASKQGDYTSSVFLTNAKGTVNEPIAYTGSLEVDEEFKVNTISTGSGTLNFSETYTMHPASSSFNLEFDNDEPTSFQFSVGTSSLEY